MQDSDHLPVRRALILLFAFLMAARTMLEFIGSTTPWRPDFTLTISFYMAGLLYALALPAAASVWRRHSGKLTAATLALLLITWEVTHDTFVHGRSPLDFKWESALGYAIVAALAGLGVSKLSDEIRVRENRIRLMTSGLTESLWVVDCRTGAAKLSESFGTAFGYKPGEIASNRTGLAALIHAEDVGRVTRSFNEAVASGADAWETTCRMRRADGTYAVVSDRCRFERDRAGVAIHAYGGILDISDRIEMENRLRELNDRLESRIAERTRELARVTFAVTHDLKSPLTSIVGYTDLAAERDSVKSDPVARRHLESVILNAERMQSFIAGLLEKSKSEPTLRPRAIPLQTVFSDLEHELAPGFAKAGGTLRFAGGAARVVGDPDTLHRIFQNLIDNALKFSRPAVPPAVTVAAHASHGVVTITVDDNGCGIPANALPRIFDLHYRADESAHRQGHGVGLANVKEELTRLGGGVQVESTPGTGTRFTITLPAS